MRYVVEHDGKYLKVAKDAWRTKRSWVDLPLASTWTKPGHAKQAANLTGVGLVTIWGLKVALAESCGTHVARKPR